MSWRWLVGYPTSDNRLYEVPAIISDNYRAIEAILGVEHETLISTGASGQHAPGRVSTVFEGTTAEIIALTGDGVPDGSLAYDTTIGYWKKYIDSTWVVMTNIHSRMDAYKTSSSLVASGDTQSVSGDWVIFDAISYDELSEYDAGAITSSVARYRDADAVSLTASTAHGLSAGDEVNVSGIGGDDYNGGWIVTATPSTTVFTYDCTASSEAYTADAGGIFKHGGVFTAQGSGDYLILTTISICASDTPPTALAARSGIANETAQFGVVGAGTNWQAVDDYPTPNDSDYVLAGVSGSKDRYTQASIGGTPIPTGATGIYLTIAYRAKGSGCSCNNACYGENCGCYSACYGYNCSCYSTCYGYSACTCNAVCYVYGKSCTCFYACYGQSGCSCNATCYGYVGCSCDTTCYNELPSCTCNGTCYNQFETQIAPIMTLSGSAWTEYAGDFQQLDVTFTDYEYTWTVSPSTGLEWTRDELNKLGHFGAKVRNDGGIESGCSAVMSQEYVVFGWYPTLPVYILRVYKNNVEVEKVFQPIIDAGAESDQTIHLSTIIGLVPGDTIRVAFVKVSDVADNIIGEATGTYTNLSIHRIEGQCV